MKSIEYLKRENIYYDSEKYVGFQHMDLFRITTLLIPHEKIEAFNYVFGHKPEKEPEDIRGIFDGKAAEDFIRDVGFVFNTGMESNGHEHGLSLKGHIDIGFGKTVDEYRLPLAYIISVQEEGEPPLLRVTVSAKSGIGLEFNGKLNSGGKTIEKWGIVSAIANLAVNLNKKIEELPYYSRAEIIELHQTVEEPISV